MRYSGNVGFNQESIEIEPGVYGPGGLVERHYIGDILNLKQNVDTSSTVNSNIKLNQRVSLISDFFMRNNIQNLAYVEYMKVKWRPRSIEILPPKVIIDLGEVYHE